MFSWTIQRFELAGSANVCEVDESKRSIMWWKWHEPQWWFLDSGIRTLAHAYIYIFTIENTSAYMRTHARAYIVDQNTAQQTTTSSPKSTERPWTISRLAEHELRAHSKRRTHRVRTNFDKSGTAADVEHKLLRTKYPSRTEKPEMARM